MQLRVRTHQGGDNRLTIAFTQATETQSRPPVESLFLKPPRVKQQVVRVYECAIAPKFDSDVFRIGYLYRFR